MNNFENIKTNFLGKQYEKYCEDCKYHNPNGFCKHPHKEECIHNELWTPKKYGRGTRANLSIIDDYCDLPQGVINEACEQVLNRSNIE